MVVSQPDVGHASSPALRVMCARALTEVASAVAKTFTERTGRYVDVTFGTVGALQAKLDAGDTADVVVLSAPLIERLQQSGQIEATSTQTIGSTGIGLAVPQGAANPDISTPETFRATLANARSVAFSDPAVGGSAGVYLAELFERIGLADMMKNKGLPQQSGGEVARRVAEGVADIGMTQISEMLVVNGIRVVGSLPKPLGKDTIYRAAVHAGSARSDAARAFIALLGSREAQELLRATGFETPAGRDVG
jgi:molybdate transport system substrate-binding protein